MKSTDKAGKDKAEKDKANTGTSTTTNVKSRREVLAERTYEQKVMKH